MKNSGFDSFSNENTKGNDMVSEEESFFDKLVWMNSEEAACYLRMTVGALRVAVCRRQIRFRKWRRRLYFKKAELQHMLETSLLKGGYAR